MTEERKHERIIESKIEQKEVGKKDTKFDLKDMVDDAIPKLVHRLQLDFNVEPAEKIQLAIEKLNEAKTWLQSKLTDA